MKIIFAGTPEFAAVALAALCSSGHEIVLVLTQPDRPAGRGLALQASPVKKMAEERGIPVFQPITLRDSGTQGHLQAVGADLMIVAAYGLILPPVVLGMPRHGCLNIHASLLPRWRGAAPIQRAIVAGDSETGVCIMQMEAGLDTGPVLARIATPIRRDDSAGSLHDRLAQLGADLMLQTIGRLPLVAEAQPADGVTYAAKIDKSEAQLDWRHSADDLDRQIRAFNPFPGAASLLAGQGVKIWRASPIAGGGVPGTILAADRTAIVVACGEGALSVSELQKAGGKRLPVANFLAGNVLKVGDRFDLPLA